MKVVLFCGGLGLRMRDYSEDIPKPMVTIGYRPILWQLMKYYAYYGHREFVLCLGYKADIIKKYFLNYDEALSNDFILTNGCKDVRLLNTDAQDWRITFVDTGLNSNIGERLKAVEKHLDGEEVFLANYADGLTDLILPEMIDHFYRYNKIAALLCVKPTYTMHMVSVDGGSIVKNISIVSDGEYLMNGGFFIFRKKIFQYIKEGEELVQEPFQRLIAEDELIAYKYDGFWTCMDTFREKQKLEQIYSQGEVPWEVWNNSSRK
jgi:glucose-1-phosphate cytidylyltransferase